MTAITPALQKDHSLKIETAYENFSFLSEVMFSTQIVSIRFHRFTIIDFHKRLGLMNLSSIKIHDGQIYMGEDSWRGEYF